MEGMAARALKSSLRRELAVVKSTQPAFYEELLCLNANNVVTGEEFSVDDLLDFSNGEFPVANGNTNGQHEDDEKGSSSGSFSSLDQVEDDNHSNSSEFSGIHDDSDSIFANGLAVPTDDIAELEWVSHFVNDSVPELPLLYPATIYGPTKNITSVSFVGKRRPEAPKAKPALTRVLSFHSPVPVKPRSKRPRTIRSQVWSSRCSSQTDSFSPPSSCSSGVISSTPYIVFNRVSKPSVKKQKKNPDGQNNGSNMASGSQFQRRCSHCFVQKTPQWRAGPLGAKTLCNACGVRYKSGRLFPEYRPACSPTFSSELHSNSHRKVLEMRKRKETTPAEQGLTQTHLQQMLVPSC